MYSIWIRDGKTEKPNSEIIYEVAANGIFLHKKTKFWKSVVPVNRISVLEEECKPSIEVNLPKIPAEITKEIVRFFSWVYKKYKSEVLMLLFLTKDSSYRIYAPIQKIERACVEYEIPERQKGEILIGTFHSHCALSAFHSSVDIGDEKRFDGLHGVIGGFSLYRKSRIFNLDLQIIINGYDFQLKPVEFMEGLLACGETEKYKKEEDAEDNFFSYYSTYFRTDHILNSEKNFFLTEKEILLPKDYLPPEEWRDNIKYLEKPVYKHNNYFNDYTEIRKSKPITNSVGENYEDNFDRNWRDRFSSNRTAMPLDKQPKKDK